jgi:Plasmid pRiA4b ORF-3-like protein
MIWTLRIKLLRCEDEWSADIEIDPTSTLEQLHYAIQKAVNFDNDHLYAFYTARSERNRNREVFDEGNERVYDTTLEALFPLEIRKSLFYLFDYGDEWMFKVIKTQKRPHDPKEGVVYPRVAAEAGTKPVQYPGHDE